MIVHRLCEHPSRGRVVRPSPEAPIYHGVEREPRTRMPATPQRLAPMHRERRQALLYDCLTGNTFVR